LDYKKTDGKIDGRSFLKEINNVVERVGRWQGLSPAAHSIGAGPEPPSLVAIAKRGYFYFGNVLDSREVRQSVRNSVRNIILHILPYMLMHLIVIPEKYIFISQRNDFYYKYMFLL
jgi:hypothetical protein